MEEAKKRGRPPKPEEEKLERRAMYLPPAVWAKVDAFGLAWARRALEKAKPPKE